MANQNEKTIDAATKARIKEIVDEVMPATWAWWRGAAYDCALRAVEFALVETRADERAFIEWDLSDRRGFPKESETWATVHEDWDNPEWMAEQRERFREFRAALAKRSEKP